MNGFIARGVVLFQGKWERKKKKKKKERERERERDISLPVKGCE